MHHPQSIAITRPSDHILYEEIPGLSHYSNARDGMHVFNLGIDERIAGSSMKSLLTCFPQKKKAEDRLKHLETMIKEAYVSEGISNDNRTGPNVARWNHSPKPHAPPPKKKKE